ncbi:MAG TPA: NADH-quinone oxidoreductase subunit J [Chloroflexi bacterium]|nr:NADH-quinone oxidoreductase subunit J [Chloroflexota bacterium]
MTSLQIVFLIIAAVTLASAVMVVTARRLMHAALWLILTLLGVAAVFATLQANFFAVVQVLVYIGAIAILIIFAIMMTREVMSVTGPRLNRGWGWAAAAAAGGLAGLVAVLSTWQGFQTVLEPLPSGSVGVGALGEAFLDPNRFAVPFEVASVLLVAAMVGAIYIAVDRKVVEEQ